MVQQGIGGLHPNAAPGHEDKATRPIHPLESVWFGPFFVCRATRPGVNSKSPTWIPAAFTTTRFRVAHATLYSSPRSGLL